jgi:X-Pro dipeptidyl-peptidase
VPVVFEQSPYRGPVGAPANHPVDVDVLPQSFVRRGGGDDEGAPLARSARARARARARGRAAARLDLRGTLDDTYVPRGYAVVLGESTGTGGSDGCPTVGDDQETLGAKAVVDWLNGRARAFDAAGAPVRADWTTGAVGMTGVSYNGTLPNQVATTGVEGLETIVPVAAISSWYDYYRANGLVVAPHSETGGVGDNAYQGEDTDVLALFTGTEERINGPCRHVLERLRERQERTTGDVTPFWADRDVLGAVDRIRASVFVVHGLNDFNVKTKAFASWWERLAAAGVERKLWLHNGGHGPQEGDEATVAAYRRTVLRWFDHELHGVPNGIDAEPRATVQREDGRLTAEADWPAPGTAPAMLHLAADTVAEPGTLSPRPRRGGPRPRQSFVDRGRELDTDDVLIQDPDVAHPNRLVFLGDELTRDVRLSGTPVVDLRLSVDDRTAANVTAVLVDYGPFGAGVAPAMVTRGWIDPQNRRRLDRSAPVDPGREYALRFDLQPDDHVFRAGHRIGLVVVSTDRDFTLRPRPGTRLSVHPARSALTLPVVGGPAALGAAPAAPAAPASVLGR